MSVMPKLSKARSIACAAVFGMGLLLLPTATARVVEDSSSDTSAKVKAQAGSAKVLDQIGGVANSSLFPSVGAESALPFVDVMASGGNIQLNAQCVGVTSTNEYVGRWKPLGSTKAKCKEGAGGTPGNFITRATCRIVTINDGNFDNAMVLGPDQCIK